MTLRFPLSLALIASLAFITGCTNQAAIAKQYELGRANFINQQYAQALPNLLAAAKQGNPEAEYAVGYLYFYGKGTEKNETLGKAWITKSARHGDSTAKQALEIINQEAAAQSVQAALR